MVNGVFVCQLTTANVERAILLVHGEIRQIHLTAGFDCQSARERPFIQLLLGFTKSAMRKITVRTTTQKRQRKKEGRRAEQGLMSNAFAMSDSRAQNFCGRKCFCMYQCS